MRKPLCLVFVCQRLPQSCSLPLSSLLLSSCFCRLLSLTLSPSHPHSACLRAAHCYNYTLLPPSLLLLITFCLSPPHPHTLTSSHTYTRTQSKSPIKQSYVLPSHPHTLTLCIISLASTHRHTLIRIYPSPLILTLSYPIHPLTVTPSFIPLSPTPPHPHTMYHTSHLHTIISLTSTHRHTLVYTTPSHTLTPSHPPTLKVRPPLVRPQPGLLLV